jgi:predicted permease
MLIACANVAGLLTTRGLSRSHEVAVRKALGGSLLRLLQQHLVEGTMLWLMGGAIGLLLVWSVTRMVSGSRILWLRMAEADISVDWRVIVFAAGVSLVCGLVFSVLPALRTLGAEPTQTLRRTASTTTRPRFAIGTVLTVVQLAVSLTLIVSALLLVSTVRHLIATDVGFEPTDIWLIRTNPEGAGLSAERELEYHRELMRRLSAHADISSAAIARSAPLLLAVRTSTRLKQYGDTNDQTLHAPYEHRILSPGYFATLGIRILRGRDFTEAEMANDARGAAPVVILSESLARSLFGTLDVIGEVVEFPTLARRSVRHEVIGVVQDVRHFDRTGDLPQLVYDLPASQEPPSRGAILLVRSRRTGWNIPAEVRVLAASVNPAVPIAEVTPLSAAMRRATADWDVLAGFATFAATMATFLAACGLYGVVAFAVASRQREFGLRLALGATAHQIRTLVMRNALTLVTVGTVLGSASAAVSTQLIENRLVGVERFDIAVWALAVILLASVSFVAMILPAQRVIRTDVAGTLRST